MRRQSDAVYKTCAPQGGHIEGERGVVRPRRPTRVASLALSAGSLVRSPSTLSIRILAAGVGTSYHQLYYCNVEHIYIFVVLYIHYFTPVEFMTGDQNNNNTFSEKVHLF